MRCSTCDASPKKPGDKLPRGWKRVGAEALCKVCFRQRYFLRAVTFPIAGPIGGKEQWPSLRAALGKCWQQSTMLANWMMTEMAKSDVLRTPAIDKMPPYPKEAAYLYPAARRVCPEMDCQSVVALLNTVQAKYRQERMNVIWRGNASLPRYSYPVPYPVPSQRWSARWLSDTEKAPIVRVRLAGEWFELRVRGGFGFERQKKAFTALIECGALPCELAIYRKRANASDHRVGFLPHAQPAGGQSAFYNIVVKLVMWLPKTDTQANGVVLKVKTGADKFISINDDWTINADHLFRAQKAHARKLHRLAEDEKLERRVPTRAGVQMADRRTLWVQKQQRRLDTFCHQATAQIVGIASRMKISTVEFDDSQKSDLSFPWCKFMRLLEQKLGEHNIGYRLASAAVATDASTGARENESRYE